MYQKLTPKKPKPRAVHREVTDEDVEALLRLVEKWHARLTIKRGGEIIIRSER